MNLDNLQEIFNEAEVDKSNFIFVVIDAESTIEIISIPTRSFKKKLEFYLSAYTYDLRHVMNKDVKIINITHGTSNELNRLKGDYSL